MCIISYMRNGYRTTGPGRDIRRSSFCGVEKIATFTFAIAATAVHLKIMNWHLPSRARCLVLHCSLCHGIFEHSCNVFLSKETVYSWYSVVRFNRYTYPAAFWASWSSRVFLLSFPPRSFTPLKHVLLFIDKVPIKSGFIEAL
jgi:hypothetical protein